MFKKLIFLVFVFFAPAGNAADIGLSLLGASQSGYTGPLDVLSGGTVCISLRACSAAIAATGTQSTVDLRRASDNAVCTAKIGTNGSIDLTVGAVCNSNTQTVTAWVGASSALVSKGYDQTARNQCAAASCDVVQATAANQPQLMLSGGSNNLPYLASTTAAQLLASAGNFTPTGPITLSVVANRASGTASTVLLSSQGGGNRIVSQSAVANKWQVTGAANTLTVTAPDAAWHSGTAVVNGASTVMNVDGTETTGTTTVSTAASTVRFAGGNTSTTSDIAEGIFWDTVAATAGQRTAVQLNQKAYYGTP